MNKALLVGINTYPGAPLNGCINDVKEMTQLLVQKCQFKNEDIRLLTDSRATTAGIKERLQWLVEGSKPGDRLLFHYSGHGAQMATRNPSGEVDGLDEVICPYDFDWTDVHAIRDKDFVRIFTPVQPGTEFVWVSDSCHSGDLSREIPQRKKKKDTLRRLLPPVDLQWRIQTARSKNLLLNKLLKKESTIHAALIAGCKSDQTSADADINGSFHGALTYYLILELQKRNGLEIPLTSLIANVVKSIQQKKYSQTPQLEGDPNIEKKPFLR